MLHRHQDEIDIQPDRAAKVNRLVEVNVMEQLRHLARLDTIQKAFAEQRELWLHGWVYDIRDGHIKTLLEIDANTDLDALARPDKVLV
ncbi:carbonic anhydrase [Sphingomonas sp. I4]